MSRFKPDFTIIIMHVMEYGSKMAWASESEKLAEAFRAHRARRCVDGGQLKWPNGHGYPIYVQCVWILKQSIIAHSDLVQMR